MYVDTAVNPAKTALNVMRVTVVVQLVMGAAFWMGRWTSTVDLHRTLGIVYVFALWLIAALAIAHHHKKDVAGFAMIWGVLIITLGFAQQSILPGEFHWITRVAHLLIGIVAIPMAEDLVKGATMATARTRSTTENAEKNSW